MRKLSTLAAVYLGIGLIAGVYYREFTRLHDYDGDTQLSTVHTHALVLGVIVPLVLIALSASISIDTHRRFTAFFITYTVALTWMIAHMIIKGSWQVLNPTGEYPAALAGISGIGHILMTVALILLLMIVKQRVRLFERTQRSSSAPAT
ncbi:hypothetical protein CCICO_09535 [Corynebacterium ciconiae DSM 44920]|uniref:DUF2871 domain-containing protein n=1 Tax=Corynebacterium ciconiae TaxID=227319 RepID=UPI00035E0BAF|nr:DUF2871 domain-containing protein [Corynebacterium ciconiae]WKD61914.1 hypothetical protein CCICO_09535 [Corynebacterium ciconiae DSM 44920]